MTATMPSFMVAPPRPGTDPRNPAVLLDQMWMLAPADPVRQVLRTQVIELYLPMAAYFARRFTGRGQPMADLNQVATIGLINAVDRFDPTRGVPFAGFAAPTILGEIRRHFRDTTWTIRVPRRLQEVAQQLAPTTEDLAHRLHRSPTTAELATRLGVSSDEVRAAQVGANAYRPLSLERLAVGRQHLRLGDMIGPTDVDIDAVDQRETFRALVAALPRRDQYIIALRFVAGLTQTQIAADIGVSQMQVSRLLTRSLAVLRAGMLTDPQHPDPAPRPHLTCAA